VKFTIALAESVSIHAGLAMAVAGVTVLWATRRKRRGTSSRMLQLATATALLGMSAQVLTGYMDRRYFTFACTMATGCAVCFVLERAFRLRLVLHAGLLFLVLVSIHPSIEWAKAEFGPKHTPLPIPAGITTPILADLECHEVGAVTRHRAVCLPSDWERLSAVERGEFVSRFAITHALIRSGNPNAPFQLVPFQPDLPLRTR
jgi:hypothetical protein